MPKISALSSATPSSGSLLAAVVNSATVKITVGDLNGLVVPANLPTATGIVSSGALFYGNSSGQISSLSIGSSGKILKSSGAIPTWYSPTVYAEAALFDPATAVASGAGKAWLQIPPYINGCNLVYVHAFAPTSGSGSSTTNVQITRIRGGASASMLNVELQIDAGEPGSETAASAATINSSLDDVATDDRLRLDVTQVTGATAPKGLVVTVGFQRP